VLARFDAGAGPDILVLCELEADQTPAAAPLDIAAFLRRTRGEPAARLLSAPVLAPELAGLPSHAWLLKALDDAGLGPYHAAVGRWRPDPAGRIIAVTNAVLSRFPIVEQRTHFTDGARGILEAVVDIDGHRLHVFANHWKSGASDPATEPIRIGNARVMRKRLDALLRRDPRADAVLAGDFNSHYDQKQRCPAMGTTAINDVLGSQGDELALRRPGGPDLYNLWFELPPERRGSDVWNDAWGTLVQMLLVPGLHDYRGVQYIDGSFEVAAFPGLNADPATGRPLRWEPDDGGRGCSDHFPIAARFRTVDDDEPHRWLDLKNPSTMATGPGVAFPASKPARAVANLGSWPRDQEFRSVQYLGKRFRVAGRVSSLRPFRVVVEGGTGGKIGLWVRDPVARAAFFGAYRVGERIEFVGELGRWRGEWQFVVEPPAGITSP
jgi:hypothetical protein